MSTGVSRVKELLEMQQKKILIINYILVVVECVDIENNNKIKENKKEVSWY